MSSESRAGLLTWVNDLLQTNYSKIEQMGTGAALCQIVDSIYGDVPLGKVNFAANQEYQYVNNFKVLQTAFANHHIDKPIPVDRLVKLKFQDNLEFLQWTKKMWDANYPGGSYDAIQRRSGGSGGGGMTDNPSQPSGQRRTAGLTKASPPRQLGHRDTRPASSDSNHPGTQQAVIADLKKALLEMERERDFYFGKLRDIEIMTQKVADAAVTDSAFFKQVTGTLYATEEGFEIPDGGSLLVGK